MSILMSVIKIEEEFNPLYPTGFLCIDYLNGTVVHDGVYKYASQKIEINSESNTSDVMKKRM